MIVGRIVPNKEPERYRPQKQATGWNRWQEDDETAYYYRIYGDSYYQNQGTAKSVSEQDLLSLINKGTVNGFVEGSRVRRSSGNPGTGTIIKVIRTLSEAVDEDLLELNPFRVTWDSNTQNTSGATFNYTLDDLILVSSPIGTQQGNKNETVPNIPLAY